jgi:hypothetical protein
MPRDFMTWHARVLKSRPQAIFDEDIAVANTTRFDFHANLARARFRDVTFHQFKISTGFVNLRGFHFHFSVLFSKGCVRQSKSWGDAPG